MASSYTPAGIELIADGEQSGTWGQTTNTNWELVEEMVAGVVSIALTATTYTLATSDGATSNGRHAVIVFTGSPGGTCTVTISPNDMQKVYFINNSSDQTVTLTQGSGANVSVSAGATSIVYCDGAGATAAVNVMTASELTTLSVTSLTTTNLTLGGTAVTSTAAELNILDGVTATAAEINALDGITATTTELNYVDGVTSAIQTQLNAKAPLASPALTGTPTAPTAATATNTTQVATTAFTQAAIDADITTHAALRPSSSVYGHAKIYLSGGDLYIETT